MKFLAALFFTTVFLPGVERLQAPDGIKKASSLVDEIKSEFWESQKFITTVESKLSTDHSSTSTNSMILSTSSSTLEQEQLVTLTEASATPSYDIDSSLPFTHIASSSESHAQASRDVLSSVIFIPPSNSVQVQLPKESRGGGVDKENSASDTVHPTKEPEILSTVLNSTPPTPISSEPTPTAPSTSIDKEEEDSITAALKQADEESTTKEEDLPSFDEFKRRVLQEEEEKSKQQNAESASGAVQKTKKVKERKQSNYASVDCGAKILEHNNEASNPQSILVENKDLYMLNPCSAQVWVVVELCDVAHIKSIQIANFELFSSTTESFRVYVSKRYPTREWTTLGTFQAREEREVQTFPLDEPIYAKYFKVEMLSHFGSEHYCPLSLLRVYGSSVMEELEDHEIEANEDSDNPDGNNVCTSSSMASMAGSAGLQKESIFVHLSNKIKAQEQNLSMIILYMEQRNQRYRMSLDELRRKSDKNVALLSNANKKAEAHMNNKNEQILQLQSQVDNLNNVIADMAARVDWLNNEMNNKNEQILQLQSQVDNLTNVVADMAARKGRPNNELRHAVFVMSVIRRNWWYPFRNSPSSLSRKTD